MRSDALCRLALVSIVAGPTCGARQAPVASNPPATAAVDAGAPGSPVPSPLAQPTEAEEPPDGCADQDASRAAMLADRFDRWSLARALAHAGLEPLSLTVRTVPADHEPSAPGTTVQGGAHTLAVLDPRRVEFETAGTVQPAQSAWGVVARRRDGTLAFVEAVATPRCVRTVTVERCPPLRGHDGAAWNTPLSHGVTHPAVMGFELPDAAAAPTRERVEYPSSGVTLHVVVPECPVPS